jgi:hypothetical protein
MRRNDVTPDNRALPLHLPLLRSGGRLAGAGDGAFTPAQLHFQAMLLLDMGRSGILVAQIFWSLWMLPLACLVFRSGSLPRVLGIAVVIAGAGYPVDSSTQLLFPGFATISRFTFEAELLLP